MKYLRHFSCLHPAQSCLLWNTSLSALLPPVSSTPLDISGFISPPSSLSPSHLISPTFRLPTGLSIKQNVEKKGDQRTCCFLWLIPQQTACHLDLTSDCCNSIKFWDEVDSHSGGGLLKLLLKVLCGSGGALSSLKITLMMPSWCH